MKCHVLVVDGVGHPQVTVIEYEGVIPDEILHEIIEKKGPSFKMPFYRTGNEKDPSGRPVFRQKHDGPKPMIRYRLLKPKVGSTGE